MVLKSKETGRVTPAGKKQEMILKSKTDRTGRSAIICSVPNQKSQFMGVRKYGMTSRMLSTPVR